MKKIRIHYLQHVSYEDPGCILQWAHAGGHQITSTKFFEHQQLPDLSEIDWLIVMGGPMGIYDEAAYPWLKNEKAYLRMAIRQNKTVMGICLGAQLIAAALGANVYPNRFKEIGWFEITLSEQGKIHPLLSNFEQRFPVFHWHGDTFDLPVNAQLLASSTACKNQAFALGNKVLGLQFHFEVTAESLIKMVENGKHELQAAQYIQSAGQLLSQTDHFVNNNQKMFQLLGKLEKLEIT